MAGVRNTCSVVSAIAVSMIAFAPAAGADSTRCSADTDCAGKATFTSHDEIFNVLDNKADGHSAVLMYWLPGDETARTVWSSGGNGTSVEKNLALDEGTPVTYRVCLGEGGSAPEIWTETCGVSVTDKA